MSESPSNYLKYTNTRVPPQFHWSWIQFEHPYFFKSYPDNANMQSGLKITEMNYINQLGNVSQIYHYMKKVTRHRSLNKIMCLYI